MYCENCGALLKEGAIFCTQCGAKTRQAAAQPQGPSPAEGQSEYTRPPYQNAGFDNVYGQYGQNYASPYDNYNNPPEPSVFNIKEPASSGLYLFAVILFSVNILYGVIFTNSVYSSVYQILSAAGIGISDLGLSISGFAIATRIASVILSVPSLLIVLGLWLIFGSAKSSSKKLKSGGIKLINVIMIIRLIFFCIAIFLAEAACLFFVIVAGLDDYGNFPAASSLGPAFIAVIALAIAGAAVVCIIYFAKILKMLGSAKRCADTGQKPFISVYVIVICFISLFSAIYSLISYISSIVTYIRYGITLSAYMIATNAFGILAVLCSAGAAILFAAVMIEVRKKS